MQSDAAKGRWWPLIAISRTVPDRSTVKLLTTSKNKCQNCSLLHTLTNASKCAIRNPEIKTMPLPDQSLNGKGIPLPIPPLSYKLHWVRHRFGDFLSLIKTCFEASWSICVGYRLIFTARCIIVQGAVLGSHVACPSVTLVDHDHMAYRLKILKTIKPSLHWRLVSLRIRQQSPINSRR